MVKRIVSALALLALSLTVCGAAAADSPDAEARAKAADEAYSKAMAERRAVEPIEERLAITKKFLDEYPESKHTARAISAVVYYQGTALGDMDAAITYAESIREKIADPAVADALDKEMIVVYGDAGKMDKMLAIAAKMEAAGSLKFNDYWSIIESGVKAEDWTLVRSYCDKAEGMANAETFKSDWPDYEMTDEELEEAGSNRAGMVLVADGWARANQGEVDEALADFEKADGLLRRSMFDRPDYDLNIYWGKVDLMKGNYESAIDRLGLEALVMKNEDALADLEKAYAGLHGGTSDFGAFAAELHDKVAPTMQNFSAPDYEGQVREYAKLKGQVTLLAFWFPT